MLVTPSLRRSKNELPVQTLCCHGNHIPDGCASGLQQQPDGNVQGAAGRHPDEREGAAEDHQVLDGRQDAKPRLTEGLTRSDVWLKLLFTFRLAVRYTRVLVSDVESCVCFPLCTGGDRNRVDVFTKYEFHQ